MCSAPTNLAHKSVIVHTVVTEFLSQSTGKSMGYDNARRSFPVVRGRGRASILPAWMTDPVLAREAQGSTQKTPLDTDPHRRPPASVLDSNDATRTHSSFKPRFDQKPEDLVTTKSKNNTSPRSNSCSSGMKTSSSPDSHHSKPPSRVTKRVCQSRSPCESVKHRTSQSPTVHTVREPTPHLSSSAKATIASKHNDSLYTRSPPHSTLIKDHLRRSTSRERHHKECKDRCPSSHQNDSYKRMSAFAPSPQRKECEGRHHLSSPPAYRHHEKTFYTHPATSYAQDSPGTKASSRRRTRSRADRSSHRAPSSAESSAHRVKHSQGTSLKRHAFDSDPQGQHLTCDILCDDLANIRSTGSLSKREHLLREFRRYVDLEGFIFEDVHGYRSSWRSFERKCLLKESLFDFKLRITYRVFIQAKKKVSYVLQLEWTVPHSSRHECSEDDASGHFALYECCENKLTRFFLFRNPSVFSFLNKEVITFPTLRQQKVWHSVAKYLLKKGVPPHTPCILSNLASGHITTEPLVLDDRATE